MKNCLIIIIALLSGCSGYVAKYTFEVKDAEYKVAYNYDHQYKTDSLEVKIKGFADRIEFRVNNGRFAPVRIAEDSVKLFINYPVKPDQFADDPGLMKDPLYWNKKAVVKSDNKINREIIIAPGSFADAVVSPADGNLFPGKDSGDLKNIIDKRMVLILPVTLGDGEVKSIELHFIVKKIDLLKN